MCNEFIFKKGDYSITELRCHIMMVCEEFKNRFPYDIDKYAVVYFITMFMECIRVACEVYIKEYPLKADEIEELLRFFKNDPTSPLITNKNEN